jgi:hypothetical protein
MLSRSFTLAGSGQDPLYEATPIEALIRVKQGCFIGLNALQGTSLPVLVLSGRMHCKPTKADNSHSYEHCCDQAYGGLGLEVLHKAARLQANRISVNRKNKKFTNGILGAFRQFLENPIEL